MVRGVWQVLWVVVGMLWNFRCSWFCISLKCSTFAFVKPYAIAGKAVCGYS